MFNFSGVFDALEKKYLKEQNEATLSLFSVVDSNTCYPDPSCFIRFHYHNRYKNCTKIKACDESSELRPRILLVFFPIFNSNCAYPDPNSKY